MKKVLQLIPQSCLPASNGGKIGLFYPMKFLNESSLLKVVVFIDEFETLSEEAYKEYGIEPIVVRVKKRESAFTVIRNLFSTQPFKFQKYYNRSIFDMLLALVKDWVPDVVICHHAHLASYGLKLKAKSSKNISFILREHNVEYLLVYQYYQHERNPLKRALSYWQFRKTRAYERNAWHNFDKTIFISDTDFEEVGKQEDNEKIVLYDGGNINEDVVEKKANAFVFSGNFSAIQNVINFQDFIYSVWIPWKRDFNDIAAKYELWITGINEDKAKKLINISDTDIKACKIKFLGFVEDYGNVVKSAKFFLSPTRIGAGIRIKVIEAICMQSVVFLTNPDLKMVKELEDMENVVLYKDLESFNEKVKLLEEDKQLYFKIANNALVLAQKSLSWNIYRTKLINIVQN